ncbi:MAG: peptidoglycan-binding protein [Gemmiger sp.]
MPNGILQVYASISGQAAPLAGVDIMVFDTAGAAVGRLITDESGATPELALDAPDKSYSLDENNTTVLPYAVYDLNAFAPGWQPVELVGVQLFDGETTVARLEFLPADPALPQSSEPIVIHEHPLFAGGGGSGPAPDGLCASQISPLVLTEVVIPKKITVHLGRPTANVSNVTVSFQNYIANVASSEVYPTWPEQALRANILAQISLALNRVYTEWYPSRGYNFNITGSPGVDQAYVQGRTVFAVMERLTAELFSTYVRRSGDTEPYYTEYCDGKSVTCPGMKQWGTVDRANEGLSALQILRYYYGNRVQLVTTNNIASIPESYPGTPLRRGSTGTYVSILQKQLARIGKDYPSFGKPEVTGTFDAATENSVRAFQKQFSLTVDGVVGRSTWYKISYIYVSVKDLAELTSEGETLEGAVSAGIWPGTVLRTGSTGTAVEQVQFWLLGLSQSNTAIPAVTVDGNYGTATANAVRAFQRTAGLTVDGVVGQQTWEALYAAWVSAMSDSGGVAYPGTAVRAGATGNNVRQIQFWLLLASGNYSALPSVTVDGRFGSSTTAAVRAFQTLFGLTADGVVGRATWNKLNEVSLAVTNNLVEPNVAPGVFPGTMREGSSGTGVRAVQYYLRQLAAFYPSVPSVTVDGVYGAATKAAVQAWQRHAGLTADGVVGALTWESLYDNATSLFTSGPVATVRSAPPLTADLDEESTDSSAGVIWLGYLLSFLAAWIEEIPAPDDPAVYDDSMRASVLSAQRYFGLTETGVVDDNDWAVFNRAALALYSATAGTPSPEPDGVWPGFALTLGSAGPAVLQVQQWLNALAGVDCQSSFVPEDGLLGSDTQQALEAWQISRDLQPLGVVDNATWEALKEAAAPYTGSQSQ